MTLHTQLLRLSVPASLLLASSASAQVSFGPGTTVPTGARANAPAFADLDGDGDLDMAVATDGFGNQDLLEISINDGAGNLTAGPVVLLPFSSSPSGVAAADFDGDGDVDLAVTLQDSNAVITVNQVAPLTFVAGAQTPTGGFEPRQITAADMDGDGDMDLVVSQRDSSSIGVLANASGSFSLIGSFPAGDDVRDHATGDFDGDGDLDVAVSSHDDRTVRILSNAGTGALSATATFGVPFGTRPDGAAAGDIDGDGDTDLVIGAGDDNLAFQNFVLVFTNTGSGLAGPVAVATQGVDTGDVILADMDGDGDLDAAATNQVSGTISVLVGAGGGFTPGPILALGNPDEMAAADLNGDGLPELAAGQRQAAGVTIFRNTTVRTGSIASYCLVNANSTGLEALLGATGAPSLAQNAITLSATQLPVDTFGMFVVSGTQDFVPMAGGSAGNLCLGGMIGRYSMDVRNSMAAGRIDFPIDLTSIPTPTGTVAAAAGETWNYQLWFRDRVGGANTSNYTNGLAITVGS